MKITQLLCVSVFSLLAFNTAITDYQWNLLRIEDTVSKRILVPSADKPLLRFTKEHVYFKNCFEVSGRYSFARSFELQLNLDSIKDTDCSLTERQINWYFRYRLKDVVYLLQHDTLQLRDKSGVNFVFVKAVTKK